ncbi:unnamed protein product [Brassica oleracea]
MMNLAFSVDDRGLLRFPDFPPITEIDGVNFGSHTREYVYRMYHMITSWALTGHWGYDNMRCVCLYWKEYIPMCHMIVGAPE